MSALEIEKIERVNNFLKNVNINEILSDHLKEYGLDELEITQFTFTDKVAAHAIRLCKHGLPAVQYCSANGSCEWGCGH